MNGVGTKLALSRDGLLGTTPAAATVVFTAHNRRDMVLEAIALALEQTVPIHVIVADDASSDGTEAAVRAAFPGVTYLRSDVSRGPCYQRNRGLEAAATEFVFPLDDDSMLICSRSLEQALAAFGEDVGVVAMPYRNVLQSETVLQTREHAHGPGFFDFVACSHGLRREAALDVGGYFEPFFYMGEETDLALRLADRGWRTVIAASEPIDHLQPPARRSYAPDFYGRRNDVLFVWMRSPSQHVLQELARVIVRGMRFAILTGRKRATIDGFLAALRAIITREVSRAPVSLETYSRFTAARAAVKRALIQR